MRHFFIVKTVPIQKTKIPMQFGQYKKVRAPRKKLRRTSYTTQFCSPPDLTRYKYSPHCVICHEPNEIGYVKINIEINSDAAVFSFRQYNYHLNTSSLVLGMTVRSLFRILRNLNLIKTKKSVLRLHCNTKTFA